MRGLPHSAVGDALTVEVAQLLTVNAAGTTLRLVFMRTAAMLPPSPVVVIVSLMPDLWITKSKY